MYINMYIYIYIILYIRLEQINPAYATKRYIIYVQCMHAIMTIYTVHNNYNSKKKAKFTH